MMIPKPTRLTKMVRKMMRSGRVTRLRAFYTIGDRFPWVQQKNRKGGRAAMTVTGCLQKGTETSTYMLTNVAGGRSYELIGTPSDVNLAPHVGHKIDVTGTAVAPTGRRRQRGQKARRK